MKNQRLWINTETGETMTYAEAREQFRNDYDGDDDCNCIAFEDIYERVAGV